MEGSGRATTSWCGFRRCSPRSSPPRAEGVGVSGLLTGQAESGHVQRQRKRNWICRQRALSLGYRLRDQPEPRPQSRPCRRLRRLRGPLGLPAGPAVGASPPPRPGASCRPGSSGKKLFHDRAYPSVMGKRCAGDATRLRRLALAQQGPGRRWPAGPVKHSPRPLGQTTWLRCRGRCCVARHIDSIHCQNDDGGVTIVEDGIGEYSAKGGPRLT